MGFISNWWKGFKDSFIYNPCKLPGILVALPGVFIGFFLGIHSKIIFHTLENQADLSGLMMFILVLMGCINIFNGVTLMSKRNLGTVITSALCSIVIAIVGVIWIYNIFYSKMLVDTGKITQASGEGYPLTALHWESIISVALAIICSLSGCVLGYFKRNKEKY